MAEQSNDSKSVRVNFIDAALHIELPADVSTETLMFVEQMLAIQLRSVRKMIERRKNEDQIPLELPGALVGEGNG